MKLHYTNILLFSLPLNILVNNKNKPYITPRHRQTSTSRVLSECDIDTSIYGNDPEMKSVKENFDRQTSQRFEEYEERMIKNRKKCKEQCDKDIQEIILKDKIQKSLSEKVEKGCLMCSYGLGGVATSVGLFGALAVKELTKAATAAAIEAAKEAGIKAGIEAVIEEIKEISFIRKFLFVQWPKFINESNYKTVNGLVNAVTTAINSTGKSCPAYTGDIGRACDALSQGEAWFSSVAQVGEKTTASTIQSVQTTKVATVEASSTYLYSAIGFSVIAILIILLVMVIIYLILRYRRKKKMNKKQQYTKLLNQ
ncbi:PIR protein, putative [Plasmodium sp. gorilla clade G1]|nr:PIR protein, putative [Plasmodium sp. gorilla clade G1]